MTIDVPGQARAVEAVHVALAEGARIVLVVGEAGVGKSHILGQIADRLDAVRVYGVAAMSHVPLGALAHLVDQPAGGPGDVVSRLARQLPADTVLVVDDIDQCDDLSLALLRTWARSTVGGVVATCRTDAAVLPDSVAAFAHDLGTAVVRAEAFTSEETEQFVEGVLGSAVDPALVAEIWRRTAGNALFVGQLLGEARLAGAIERRPSGWVLARPLTVPTRLRQMLLARLEGMDDEALAATRFLAVVGRCEVSTIERSDRTDAVQRLFEGGIVQFDDAAQEPEALFAHPLFAEVVMAAMSPLQRREALREHVRLEETSSSPDLVRAAVLGLDAGEPTDPEALLAAARLANAGGDTVQTQRLAEAAMRTGHGDQSAVAAALAAGAAAERGQVEAAVEILRSALETSEPGLGAVVVAVTLHEMILWAMHDQPAAAAVLRSEARRYPPGAPFVTEAFTLAEADGLTYSGRAREALALLDGLPADDGLPSALGSMLATSRAHAATLLGRTSEAITIATAGHEALIAQLESEVPGSRAKHLVIASHALREHGHLDEALDHAERAHEEAVVSRQVTIRAWAALNAAAAHLQRGDLDAAVRWAGRSLLAAETSGMIDAERLALGVLCVAQASRGLDVEPARRARLEDMPRGVGFLVHQLPIALGWLAYADGGRARAEQILVAGQQLAAEQGAVSTEAWILHERLRMGQCGGIAERLASLGADSPLARARLTLAAGIENRDPARLELAGDEFLACGARLFAAEAWSLAASQTDSRRRVTLLARADQTTSVIGSPRSPLRRGLPARDPLSPRERLVAELAATGASNAQIASELTLSVRTVENHLARVYTKLGVRSRLELPDHVTGQDRAATV